MPARPAAPGALRLRHGAWRLRGTQRLDRARRLHRPRRLRRRGRAAERGLEALHARHQRAGGGIDLRRGGLDQGRLQARARVGPVLDRAQGLGQEVEQAHEARTRDAPGLLGEALVAVGGQPQLVRDLPQRLHDEQVARVGLEVLEELGDVAARVGQARGGEPRGAGIAGGDGVEGLEEQVDVGDAEHGEDVVGRDVGARVGDELLERAERVAERAGRVAGEQRDGVGRDLDRLGVATRVMTVAICSTVGRAKSKRWQRSTTVGRTFCASVVARTKIVCGGGSSSVLRNAFQACEDSMCASSRM